MLDALKEKLGSLPEALSNKKFLIVLFVIAIFVAATYYVYTTYVAPRLNPEYVANSEFIESNEDSKNADLYFFTVDWCPHCKKAKPIWDELASDYQNKPVNGYKVNFIEVDCEKDAALADKFKVEGYPTIKLIKDNQVVEYDAKPNKSTLEQFLHTTL